MKKLLVLVVLMSLFFVVNVPAAPLSYVPPSYSVDITSPSSSEDIDGGSTYRIKWTDTGQSFAAVYVSLNNGKTWTTLYSCNKNAHRQDWSVPETATTAGKIKVELYGSCASGPIATDIIDVDITVPKPEPEEDPCECDSCSDCSNKLENTECAIVTLTRDISHSDSVCVHMEATAKIFDCDENSIHGGASSKEFYYGIDVLGPDNIVRNCEVSGFEVGINAHWSDRLQIMDNTLTENYASGAYVTDSDNVEIEENTIEENGDGIHMLTTQHTKINDNTICWNDLGDIVGGTDTPETSGTKNNNKCDFIYDWNDDGDVTWCEEVCNMGMSTSVGSGAGLQGALDGEYGTVDLTGDISLDNGLDFGASHVTLDCGGHTISGSGFGIGILMENRVDNEIANCVIEEFGTGLELRQSSHIRVHDNTMRNNDYGTLLRSDTIPSRGNEYSINTIKKNDIFGVYLIGDLTWDNYFTNNDIYGKQYSVYTEANCNNNFGSSNEVGLMGDLGYYHDTSDIDFGEDGIHTNFGELILCNVDGGTLTWVTVSNGGEGTDGILVIDSNDVDLISPIVGSTYEGATVINSENINFAHPNIRNTEKDCVDIYNSTGITMEDGTLGECDRGILISSSTGCDIDSTTIEDVEIAGVQLWKAPGNTLNHVEMDNSASDANGTKGFYLTDNSNDNTFNWCTATGFQTGVSIDDLSDNNEFGGNSICDNGYDIYDYGTDNSGINNKCTLQFGWADSGQSKGCNFCCDNIRRDINNDGIDDACDCYDVLQGLAEEGVDCGGYCDECVECEWCSSDVEPLRVKGRPNDGFIDIVFVPHSSFASMVDTNFTQDATSYVRNHYLKLNNYTYLPLPENYRDSYNFYLYKDGYGESDSCAGDLPGEDTYVTWAVTCSLACVASLGIACGCFAHEPDHFYGDAGWADTAGILTLTHEGCANTLGPQSHFIAEQAYQVVIHESGHAVFGLVDEYCGDTSYSENDPHANVWSTGWECREARRDRGWVNGSCREIAEGSCDTGYYRYDPDAPLHSYMTVWSGVSDYMFWEAASERIQYVFNHYPGGGSRGVLVYVNQVGNGTMKKAAATVVDGHPDQGMQVAIYWVEVLSADKTRIDEFGLWDHRFPLADGTGSSAEKLENITFPINFPFHENPGFVNIYNATSGELEVSMDIRYELYGWCSVHNWEGEDCQELDIDANGVPDYQETDGWDPSTRVEEEEFGDRPDLEKPEKIPPAEEFEEEEVPEESKPEEKESVTTQQSGGMNLTWIIAILVLIVVVLFVFLVLKKKKPQGKKPVKTETNFCKKCGEPVSEAGDKFCHKCGEKH